MNISTPTAIANEIKSRETGTKFFHTKDGRLIIINIVKGVTMHVKQENSKKWFDCVEYDKKGTYITDWVETNPKELQLYEIQKGI